MIKIQTTLMSISNVSPQALAFSTQSSSSDSYLPDTDDKLADSQRQVHRLKVRLEELQAGNRVVEESREELERTVNLVTNIVERAPVGMIRLCADGFILSANTQCRTIMQTPTTILVNAPFANFLTRESQDEFKKTASQVLRSGGIERVIVALSKSRSPTPNLLILLARGRQKTDKDGLIASILDISKQQDAEEQLRNAKNYLERIAHQDTLTNLCNRARFSDVLRASLVQCRKSRSKLALLYFDIDGFKAINDEHGHHSGDILLREIANRLRTRTRDVGKIARLGGDEFALILEHVKSVKIALEEAAVIAESIRQPILLGNHTVEVNSSIGVCMYPTHAVTPDEIIRGADAAMYFAKSGGGKEPVLFSNELRMELKRRHDLESGIVKAIENGEFELHFQPIFSSSETESGAAEALIRWEHPKYGMVMPDEFIPIAEKTGKIIELGWCIFDEACRTVSELPSSKGKWRVCVNLSPKQLEYPDIEKKLLKLMNHHGIQPASITLEITESSMISEFVKIAGVMERLKKAGFSLAIDDFGTGYSSLARLDSMQSDIIKLDRQFIANVGKSHATAAIVDGLISIAHKLGQTVVAEGVETEDQKTLLESCGCDYMQGYLFSKPLPKQDFLYLIYKGFKQVTKHGYDFASNTKRLQVVACPEKT